MDNNLRQPLYSPEIIQPVVDPTGENVYVQPTTTIEVHPATFEHSESYSPNVMPVTHIHFDDKYEKQLKIWGPVFLVHYSKSN